MTDKEAVDILKGWLDYNKRNKNILREADKIIAVQETVLNLIENQLNRLTELEKIEEAHRELNGELRKELQLKDRMIDGLLRNIKKYFKEKASEENG